MEPHPFAQFSEIGVGLQDFVARALHDGEELGPRKQAPAIGRELRSGDPVGEREDRRRPQVQVCAARARKGVEDLRAGLEGRDKEDLLVHGMSGAERGELLKKPVAFDCGWHGRSVSAAEACVIIPATWKEFPSGCRH